MMTNKEDPAFAGIIEVSLQSSKSSATKLFSTYPLRILYPKKVQFDKSIDCAWFYTVSFGGGLVSGDCVPMFVDVQEKCTASVCTQGTTKVYKANNNAINNEAKTTKQTLDARIGKNALLCWLPDPAQCFKDAKFAQVHEISLEDCSSSLCFVDWITAGRVAHDDARWAFRSFCTKTTVKISEDITVIESQRLENTTETNGDLAKRMANAHVIASVILVGPRTETARKRCSEYAKETSKITNNAASWLTQKSLTPGVMRALVTVSNNGDDDKNDCLVMRVCAIDMESAYEVLRKCLKPLESEIGCPPYNERGGS
jgi:urease accessory protein